jgi:hypothetical protein
MKIKNLFPLYMLIIFAGFTGKILAQDHKPEPQTTDRWNKPN